MRPEEVKVCILRMEGTNCEQETYEAFEGVGASPEFVHIKQLEGRDTESGEARYLEDYHIVMLPGGFSAGDYIRAGAIFASRLKANLSKQIVRFIEEGKGIGGFCNGFQIMTELGILPAYDVTMSSKPQAVLHSNDSGRFECRPTLLRMVNDGKCKWTSMIEKDEIRLFPSAHAEGKFTLPAEEGDEPYKRLFDGDRIVFRYSDGSGDVDAPYPFNPNGSKHNIAGICNEYGNVFGMMPHPERVFHHNTHPDWYRRRTGSLSGDGRVIFESIMDYVMKRF